MLCQDAEECLDKCDFLALGTGHFCVAIYVDNSNKQNSCEHVIFNMQRKNQNMIEKNTNLLKNCTF